MFRYMRVETPDAYGLKPLQDKILQIAAYIDKVCEKNGITYSLMGGSALGAIRHCGFIPWDDDLDIFMKPKDYEKFRNYFRQCGDTENYYLQELTERDGKILSAKAIWYKQELCHRIRLSVLLPFFREINQQ